MKVKVFDVRRQCLDSLDLSVPEATKGLGVTGQALSAWSMGRLRFPLIWQFVFQRRSVQARRRGSVCKWLMTFGGRVSAYRC
jgi:hypothetical protein